MADEPRDRRTPAWLRLLRLWRLYGTMDLLWTLRDLPTLLTFFASDLIINLAAVTGTFLLAQRFGGIGRWNADQVLFMLGYALLVTGVPDFWFNYNVSFISRRIGRGQLDHSLIQPLPLWMAFLTEGFSPFSAGMTIVPGIVVLIVAGARLRLAVSLGWLALLLLNLLASVAILLALQFAWGSLAFWAPRAAEEINSSTDKLFRQLMRFPLDSLAPALAGMLVTVLPVGLLAWYPARSLLGLDGAGLTVFVTPAAAVVVVSLAVWVFRRGLRQYGRTGSQRYLSLGHRG
jgi:viologen exporter family transport system permease protein